MVVFQHLESYCVTTRGAFRLFFFFWGYFSPTNGVTVSKEQIHSDLLRSFPATLGKAAAYGPSLPHGASQQKLADHLPCRLLPSGKAASCW